MAQLMEDNESSSGDLIDIENDDPDVTTLPAIIAEASPDEPVLKKLKDEEGSSMKVNADVEEFGMKHLKFFTDLLKFPPKSDEVMKDLRMNPGLAAAGDVKGLPPTIVGCAGMDPLRDEGLLYAKTLAEAG